MDSAQLRTPFSKEGRECFISRVRGDVGGECPDSLDKGVPLSNCERHNKSNNIGTGGLRRCRRRKRMQGQMTHNVTGSFRRASEASAMPARTCVYDGKAVRTRRLACWPRVRTAWMSARSVSPQGSAGQVCRLVNGGKALDRTTTGSGSDIKCWGMRRSSCHALHKTASMPADHSDGRLSHLRQGILLRSNDARQLPGSGCLI